MPVYKQGSFPPAYGSAQDPRYTDVTQLDYLTTDRLDDEENALLDDVTECDVDDTFNDIRPASEMPQWAPIKQIFQFTTIVNNDGQQAIPFKAQTIRVDNHTNLWVFIPQIRIWIPNNWYGAVFSTTGLSAIQIVFQAPPGFVNPAPTSAAMVVNCVAHSERLPDNPGTKQF